MWYKVFITSRGAPSKVRSSLQEEVTLLRGKVFSLQAEVTILCVKVFITSRGDPSMG